MQLIDGKATAAAMKEQIAQEVAQIVAAGGKQPHLVAVLVGHDGGSETYVKNKVLACEKCGFKSTLIRFEEDVTEEELLLCVDKLNKDADVDGFIVQLPLPKHIDEQKITMAIDYRKDVDGFHPVNVGRMSLGMPSFISATPLGILTLLQHYQIETSGKKCVILGRSNIVGKPMAQLMMQKQWGDATVTVCHSHSANLKEECREADIIIAAIGKPNFVTADMVKDGAVVIDVGMNRDENGKLCGDVDFEKPEIAGLFSEHMPYFANAMREATGLPVSFRYGTDASIAVDDVYKEKDVDFTVTKEQDPIATKVLYGIARSFVEEMGELLS